MTGLNLAHAAYTARVGGRSGAWLYRAASLHPGLFSVPCWLLWAWLQAVNQATTGLLNVNGNPSRIPGTAGIAAAVFHAVAVFCTIGAFTVFFVALASEPTHRYSHGQLRRVKGHTTWADRKHGHYTRLRPSRLGVVKDWKSAQADVRRTDRHLSRLATARQRHWERTWATEDAWGAERSQMGLVDRVVTRKAREKERAKRQAKAARGLSKRRRSQLEAELTRQETAIRARWAADRVAVALAAPKAGVDAAAPPVAPGSTAGSDPLRQAWAERSRQQANRTVEFLAQLQGYEPALTPTTNGSEP